MSTAYALTFHLPEKTDSLVGHIQTIFPHHPDDDLYTIARLYDMGFYELIEANRDIAYQKWQSDMALIIPSQFILPAGDREGIVINLAEMRLYYYPPHKQTVITYPIGIGRLDWATPLGITTIIEKKENPDWYVPNSIKKAAKQQGKIWPDIVKSGPGNPLGKYAMRLDMMKGTYLIHGTNDPRGVGMRITAGCIRLFPEDIDDLFHASLLNTKVRIINKPYKLGWQGETLYLEMHEPLQEDTLHQRHSLNHVIRAILVTDNRHNTQVDWSLVERVVKEQTGMPVAIGFSESNNP